MQRLEHDGGFAVRTRAACILRLRANEALEAVPALRRAVKRDRNAPVRAAAIEALAAIAPGDRSAISSILERLTSDRSYQPRLAAAIALGELREGAEPLTTALLQVDEEVSVRCAVASALGKLGKGTEALLAVLQREGEPVEVRYAAVSALGPTGASNERVVAVLDTVVQRATENFGLCCAAIAALGRLGGHSPAAVQALLRMLSAKPVDKRSQEVTLKAAEALGTAGPAAAEAIAALLPMLHRDQDFDYVSFVALKALWRIGGPGTAIRRDLVQRLQSDLTEPHWLFRKGALETIAGLGPEAKEMTGALVRCAWLDLKASIRELASHALTAIDPLIVGEVLPKPVAFPEEQER
jgi:HEAT repeat protein